MAPAQALRRAPLSLPCMKTINHKTAGGVVLHRVVRKHAGRRNASKQWYLIRWERKRASYFGLGRDLKAAAKRAAQLLRHL